MVFRNISVSSPVEIVVHALFFDVKEEKVRRVDRKLGKEVKSNPSFQMSDCHIKT